MRQYEGMFILPPNANPETHKAQLQSLEQLIQKFEGKITHQQDLGKKLMGYPVGKSREGYLVVTDFQMPPEQVRELRKALELDDTVLKYMITVKTAKQIKEANRPRPVARKPRTERPEKTKAPASA